MLGARTAVRSPGLPAVDSAPGLAMRRPQDARAQGLGHSPPIDPPSTETAMTAPLSLDQELAAFRQRRFLAMPLAGTVAWALVGLAGALLAPRWHLLAVFVLTGCIAYLGMGLSKLTGEDFMAQRQKNRFDGLFMLTVGQALLAYAIAIPVAIVRPDTAVFTVGMLTGFMWLPCAWLMGHWIAAFHAVARTVLILLAWWLAPAQGMLWVPLIVLALYALTIATLERRWQARRSPAAGATKMPAWLPR